MAALLIESEIFEGGKEEINVSSSDFLASESSSSFQDSTSPSSTSEVSEEYDKKMKLEKQRSSLSGNYELCVCGWVNVCFSMFVLREG